jgi:GAF domain-containing protein
MPPDEKSQKRVEKLFSDLEQIAMLREPLTTDRGSISAEKAVLSTAEPVPTPPFTNDGSTASCEMDTLLLRIRELETRLQDSEKRTASAKANPAPSILYETKEVGYAYSGDHVLPIIPDSTQSAGKLENAIKAPLTASGETIGEMKVESPAEHTWSTEETNLANAVAQQVSLQIQNLRLLAATERARAEAQAANRQFTHQNWESFMDGIRNSERIGYMYDQSSVAPFGESAPDKPDFQETVNVLDEHVGNLFLKADPARPLTAEDKEMVSAVARQIAQQVESLRLLADASRARANAEEATRRLTRENWQSFTNQKADTLGFAYDSIQVTPFGETQSPQDISFEQPLTVRGEPIGQLTVAGLKTIPPEALELANSIATQVSAHIENLRLFELNERRARELETVAVVSTTASTTLDPDELLQSVVDLTKERFNLYHAHVYLADESWSTLLLASGAGDIGRQMVTAGHAIPMDSEKSLVARATRERSALIVNDVRKEPDFLPNPYLPDTRSEMAIPMVSGDKVIGVFDVQSSKAGYFSQEDANIYTTLALQVAVALQNARLYSCASWTASNHPSSPTCRTSCAPRSTPSSAFQM